jgi:hypothetical protein
LTTTPEDKGRKPLANAQILIKNSHRAAVAILLSLAAACHAAPAPYGEKAVVHFRTLPYVADPHPLDPYVHYVGGYEMTATGTSLFVGLSDLQLFPKGDGLHAEAISDSGAAAVFDLVPDGHGGFKDSPLDIDILHDSSGKAFYGKVTGDSEDIAYNPATMDRYVSFEGNQRILKYPAGDTWRGRGEQLPVTGLPKFLGNFGMEGLTYIRDPSGDSLLIGVEAGGFWDCDLKDYACRRVKGPPVPGILYMMTSLAVLDYASPATDHEILALYRYYDPALGPRNVLSLLRLEGDRAHGLRLVKIGNLLRVAPPLPYDNFEGVSAVPIPGGYRLYLICDVLHDADVPKILIYDWKAP